MSPIQLSICDAAVNQVCARFTLSPTELESRRASWKFLFPRMLAIHLCHTRAKIGCRLLGHLFGRDPMTIHRSLRRIQDLIHTEPGVACAVRIAEQRLDARLSQPDFKPCACQSSILNRKSKRAAALAALIFLALAIFHWPHSASAWTTNTYYLAATAMNSLGMESDYSNEIVYRTAFPTRPVTLAWDPSPAAANETIGYLIYIGDKSRTYTGAFTAFTNTTLTIRPERPKTNCILTIIIQTSSSTNGPWTNWQTLSLTNPATSAFYRTRATKNGSTWTLRPEQRTNCTPGTWSTPPGLTNRTQSTQPVTRFRCQTTSY